MAYFTYQWTNFCCDRMYERNFTGLPTDKAAGNNFKKRGVDDGDVIYIVAVRKGRVYLIGRMRVKVLRERNKNDGELWPGRWIIDGEDGTPLRFKRILSAEVLGELQFTTKEGVIRCLSIDPDGLLSAGNQQAIRSVRQITSDSAILLDTEVTET